MNSVRKRAAIITVGRFYRPRNVVSDGSITAPDRAQIAWSYPGAFTDGAADGGGVTPTVQGVYIPTFRPRRGR